MGRPIGAQNKDKPFREALRMELAKAGDDMKALRSVASALISKAQGGDVQAIKEVADRLDGKPPQEATVSIERREVREFTDDELQSMLAKPQQARRAGETLN